MITERKGDLFSVIDPLKKQLIVHGVNCQRAMGSGFAKQIREKYPDAFEKYIDWCAHQLYYKGNQPQSWLGKVQFVRNTFPTIANCFTQYSYGRDGKKYVSYDAIDSCLIKVASFAKENDLEVHMPQIGAGLGGGNWSVINEIIEHRLKNVKEVNIWFMTKSP